MPGIEGRAHRGPAILPRGRDGVGSTMPSGLFSLNGHGDMTGCAGSGIAVVATDAPLLPGQCKALARRVPLGLARTGTTGGHFSGDIGRSGRLSPALPHDLVVERLRRSVG